MIPKVIHYCWFGRAEKDKLTEKCIRSWKRKCPDYTIVEWNEDNYSFEAVPSYVKKSIEDGIWAFATDYIRYDLIYRYGGIYLDTDVELVRRLDPFLKNRCYFGIESETQVINSGLGFGAEKQHPILLELLKTYEACVFKKEDILRNLNTKMDYNVFESYGFQKNGQEQILRGDVHCYPMDYFSPFYPWRSQMMKRTRRTVSIHWYSLSWLDEKTRKDSMKFRREREKDRIIHLPNRIGIRILGETRYDGLKHLIRRNRPL